MNECVICLEKIHTNNLDCYIFNCNHNQFHKKCLEKSLKINYKCPLCRKKIIKKNLTNYSINYSNRISISYKQILNLKN